MGASVVPATLPALWDYLTGAQYETFELHEARFYLRRVWDHARIFLAAFLWVGIVPAWIGATALWRRDRREALALLLMLVMNLAFFTFHRWHDYGTMVVASYFLFAIAIAVGLARLWHRGPRIRAGIAVSGIAILGALQLDRLPEARAIQAESSAVDAFARGSFAAFPDDAIVVARWGYLTPLRYVQVIHGERADVTLIERCDAPRVYPFGRVPSWRAFVAERIESRPVIVDTQDHGLGLHVAEPIDSTWFRLERAPTSRFELPGTAAAAPSSAREGATSVAATPRGGARTVGAPDFLAGHLARR
jgi:hypothetical protein